MEKSEKVVGGSQAILSSLKHLQSARLDADTFTSSLRLTILKDG